MMIQSNQVMRTSGGRRRQMARIRRNAADDRAEENCIAVITAMAHPRKRLVYPGS